MNWFDEQVRNRIEAEDDSLSDMYLCIAESVNGKAFTAALRDERELTLNALERILKYYHVRKREIPDRVRTMEDVLEYLLRPSGIMTRNVKLEKGWRHDASGAMLATFKKNGKPVALIPFGSSGYTFVHPETGFRERVTKLSEHLFSDDAIVFYKPFPTRKLDRVDLRDYIFENVDHSSVLLYILASAIVAGVGLLIPWQTGSLFSLVVPLGDLRVLMAMTIFILCTSLSSFLLEILKELFLNRISLKLDLNIEAAAMMRILSLPVAFFSNYNSGDLANRARYMSNFSSELFVRSFSALTTIIFSFVYLIQIIVLTPAFVVPVVAILFFTIVLIIITAYFQTTVSRKQMELASRERGTAYSMLAGIKKIRLNGAESRALVRWGRDYSEQSALLYDPPLFLKLSQSLTLAVSLFGNVFIYYYALRSGTEVSEFYTFNAAFGMLNGAFLTFSSAASSVARLFPVFSLVKPIMEAEPEVAEEKPVVDELKGEVELDSVTFSYGDDFRLPVIDNLSFRIKPGEYVGIVGSTGCGKSTLMRLMLGFETPQKGAIYYDGKNMNTLDLKSLRANVGTVLQDGKIFTGSIFSNIAINAPDISIEEVWELVRLVGLENDIKAMPMQLFTQVADRADNISGGQKQRIMLAMALASKPRILIMDEATSSLDNINQKNITDILNSLDCTKIVIAHSLSTVMHCDRILVLDHGKIAEEGTYDELVAFDGIFAELVRRQAVH